MSEASELTEFLNARLNDDEELANKAIDAVAENDPLTREWVFGEDGFGSGHRGLMNRAGLRYPVRITPESAHINRHSPDRVLREVAAKRGVIREMEAARTNLEERGINVPFFITWTLWHLAAVYSDHPDYQKEWEL